MSTVQESDSFGLAETASVVVVEDVAGALPAMGDDVDVAPVELVAWASAGLPDARLASAIAARNAAIDRRRYGRRGGMILSLGLDVLVAARDQSGGGPLGLGSGAVFVVWVGATVAGAVVGSVGVATGTLGVELGAGEFVAAVDRCRWVAGR